MGGLLKNGLSEISGFADTGAILIERLTLVRIQVESSSELQKRFTDKMKKGICVKKISKDRPQFECKITLNEDETTISFEGGDSAVDPECASVVRSMLYLPRRALGLHVAVRCRGEGFFLLCVSKAACCCCCCCYLLIFFLNCSTAQLTSPFRFVSFFLLSLFLSLPTNDDKTKTKTKTNQQEVAELTVRRATDPDPEQKHFAGSKVLRDNLDPREAMKAFIIVAKGTTTINLLGESEAEAEVLVTGFMLLIKKVKTTY